MLCEHCKQRNANVKYTQIINGIKREVFLCDKCSKELGVGEVNFNMPIDFASFFGDFLNEYNEAYMPILSKQKPIQCDKCNMTYSDFVHDGKFGCSHCYDVFSENIDPILKRLHGSNRYIGRKAIQTETTQNKIKETKKEENENSVESKIRNLKLEIKKMIKEEKYEEAAKIRDEIKKLEQGN